MTGFVHPEIVAGRRLWMDQSMRDIIDKIKYGDPVLGWEGDDMLDVFALEGPRGVQFELMRYEQGDYSLVARSSPGVPFDERVIHALVARDMRRNPKRDLHAEVEAHNEALDKARQDYFDEMIAEEVAPRMIRSMRKEGWA